MTLYKRSFDVFHLSNVCCSDVEKIREGIAEKVPMFVYLVMSFVTAVLISFWYGWELTVVILACAPIIIATTAVVAKVDIFNYSYDGMVTENIEVKSDVQIIL